MIMKKILNRKKYL
ncbi:hypothetical protein BLA29_011946 [Euroglyphus maynei]|uniref:Uncharacterized protein n=1 Tax=Euroglyphus maynei TaxID=6958 RepID=A0A1Y3BGF9_EURMA|nr:hypothetical protein BLA29_011946 [Euroglyphus maynei]